MSVSNRCEHCIIEYAGSEAWDGNDNHCGAIAIGPDYESGSFSMIGGEIRESGCFALYVSDEDSNELGEFSDVVLSANAKSVFIHQNYTGQLSAGGFKLGAELNDDMGIAIFGNPFSDVEVDQTWPAFEGFHYLVYPRYEQDTGLTLSFTGALTISPGAVVKFGEDTAIESNGSINAEGTAAAPIVFEGLEDIQGYWQGVAIVSKSTSNVLSHVTISGAGSDPWTGNDEHVGAIYLEDASLTLTDVQITNAKGNGIYVYNSFDDVDLTCDGVTFSDIEFEDLAYSDAALTCS